MGLARSQFLCVCLALCLCLIDANLKYGKVIALRHAESGVNLYASATASTHPGSSLQNQVVGVEFQDSSCYWRILPATGVEFKSVEGQPIRDADVVRLQHINTKKLLHSHQGYVSAVTQRQEVTGFNDATILDRNDNWILRVMAPKPGEPWTLGIGARFMHQSSGAKLFSEPGKAHSNFTSGYQEVAASMQEPETLHGMYEWQADHVDTQCETGKPVDTCIQTLVGDSAAKKSTEFQKFLQIFRAWDDERFKHLNDDPNNTPKEISIYCPQNPSVNIQELDYTLQAQGDCMVLNLQSPHLEAKLSLKCSTSDTKKSGDTPPPSDE